jgi:uncharacterized protein
MVNIPPPRKSKRGFASMDPAKRKAIASKGGLAVPDEKRSFSVNRELAAAAGRLGGAAVKAEQRAYSKDKELAKVSGRKGGLASHHGHAPRGR